MSNFCEIKKCKHFLGCLKFQNIFVGCPKIQKKNVWCPKFQINFWGCPKNVKREFFDEIFLDNFRTLCINIWIWPTFGHFNFWGNKRYNYIFQCECCNIQNNGPHIWDDEMRRGCYINVHFLGKVKVPVDISGKSRVSLILVAASLQQIH